MNMGTKAGLKALRERVGLSQRDLAAELGVAVQSVKRWEREDMPYLAPQVAWDVLEHALDVQREMVDFMVEKVHEIEQSIGRPPDLIPITYYRDQKMYDLYGRDAGTYGRAKATARAVATLLEKEGYKVEFRYPQEGAVRAPKNNC